MCLSLISEYRDSTNSEVENSEVSYDKFKVLVCNVTQKFLIIK